MDDVAKAKQTSSPYGFTFTMQAGKSKIHLPETLLQQIAGLPGRESGYGKQSRRKSRKETRKQARAERKQRRAEFFSSASFYTVEPKKNGKRALDSTEAEALATKRRKLGHEEMTSSSTTRRPAPRKTENLSHPPKVTEHSRPAREKNPAPRKRSQVEEDEDAYILYLESELKKRGSKRKEEDGLDDLMNFVSDLGTSDLVEGEESVGDSQLESESGSDSQLEEEQEEPGEEADEEEWKGCEIPPSESSGTHESSEEFATPSGNQPLPVPINESAAHTESDLKVTRQIKGLLNRMSESNIDSILSGIEDAYRAHARRDVTCTLTSQIIATLASPSSHLDTFVLIYATLVSALGRVAYGGDFVPYLLQKVVEAYDQYRFCSDNISGVISSAPLQQPSSTNHESPVTQGKQATNLMHLLTCLYNLQVVSCVLIFDLVRELLEGRSFVKDSTDNDLRESDVELVLTVVRSSGPQLRSDDPTALKDIAQTVQEQSAQRTSGMSSRTRFMIETLNNLKNNKLKRTERGSIGRGLQGFGGGDALERMKKFLNGLSKRRQVHAYEPLRLTLADLRSAEAKGKWWLVGAAWSGDPLLDRQAAQRDDQGADQSTVQDDLDDEKDAIMKLARKQGMNTDIRRAIFVVLMSSDDCIDACDRLAALRLTEIQQREIVKVLLHCCGNEKVYNPYYTLVCQRLCGTSYAYKVTLQYALWDFLRELGEKKVGGKEVIKNKDSEGNLDARNVSETRMKNVAAAYGWWIAKDCIGLAVLKPVDFTSLKHNARFFLKELLKHVFVDTQTTSPFHGSFTPSTARDRVALESVFTKATQIGGLATGLTYFIRETFPEDETPPGSLVAWAAETARGTLAS